MRSVKRHQAVYGVLAEYMGSPIHALALHTYTADEWRQREGSPDSPNCLGGGKA
jgi:stress-induced morphogen